MFSRHEGYSLLLGLAPQALVGAVRNTCSAITWMLAEKCTAVKVPV
jgi:hypothetical protein